jgi:hypothetical protein
VNRNRLVRCFQPAVSGDGFPVGVVGRPCLLSKSFEQQAACQPLPFVGHFTVPAEEDDLKSGPQMGDKLPGPFLSLVASSEDPSLVGKKIDCLV